MGDYSVITEFPLAGRLEERIHKYQDDLEKLYDDLNQCHAVLNTLEERASKLEHAYNETLSKYARVVGTENIPVGYLEYSTLAMIYTDEEGQFHVEFKEEDS